MSYVVIEEVSSGENIVEYTVLGEYAKRFDALEKCHEQEQNTNLPGTRFQIENVPGGECTLCGAKVEPLKILNHYQQDCEYGGWSGYVIEK